MTAATVDAEAVIGLHGIEMVTLTASNGETYISKKFATIKGAVITSNQAASATEALTVTFATNVATISAAGDTTDVPCTLIIYGE